jgi:hypothetical protein
MKKHAHLLPILSFFPLLLALLAVTQLNLLLDPMVIALVAISYIAINIIYRGIYGTLQVGYIVEYSLVALISFFVLTQYI